MTKSGSKQPLKVYWQPGCSSCLKTKEFLLANGMEFESINVLEDENGFRELEALGLRLVPIVARGRDWANGAVFRDVAKVAGFEWGGHDILAPGELLARIDKILSAARGFTAQIPEHELDTLLPGRPRSYRQLAYHIFQIPDVFLNRVEHDAPYTYEALISQLPPELETLQDLLDYGAAVRSRLNTWWQSAGTGHGLHAIGKGLLRRRDPARSIRANRLAFRPAHATVSADPGEARHIAIGSPDGSGFYWPTHARERMGQRKELGMI